MKKLIGLMVLGVIFFIGGQWMGLGFSEANRSKNSENAQNGSASAGDTHLQAQEPTPGALHDSQKTAAEAHSQEVQKAQKVQKEKSQDLIKPVAVPKKPAIKPLPEPKPAEFAKPQIKAEPVAPSPPMKPQNDPSGESKQNPVPDAVEEPSADLPADPGATEDEK